MANTLNIPANQLPNAPVTNVNPIYFSQEDAFTCLYDAYVDRIYCYVYFRVVDDDFAEKITSQVFLEAWEKLPSYETGRAPIISWLYSIAYQMVVSHGYHQDMPINVDNTSLSNRRNAIDQESVPKIIKSEQLYEALRELADKQQQVVILQMLCGFSTAKMVRPHDKQQGAIRALQMRSIKDLNYFPLPIEELYGQ